MSDDGALPEYAVCIKGSASPAAKDIFGERMCAANLISETLDSGVIQCDGMPAIHRLVTEPLIVESQLKAC